MLIKKKEKKMVIWFFLCEFNNFNFKNTNKIYKNLTKIYKIWSLHVIWNTNSCSKSP